MDERLDSHVFEEDAVEGNEAIVHVSVIDEMGLGVVSQGMVELMP